MCFLRHNFTSLQGSFNCLNPVPVITAYSSARSAEPKISHFIFSDAQYGIICQTLCGGKIRKGFSKFIIMFFKVLLYSQIMFTSIFIAWMICSVPVIPAYSSAKSAEPKISHFIFRDAINVVICQALRGGKIGKGFRACPELSRRVITAYSARRAEPNISCFVSHDAKNFVICEPFRSGKICKVFPVITAYSSSISAEPEISTPAHSRSISSQLMAVFRDAHYAVIW